MGNDSEKWVKEDGGWEDMVDEGHPLADYMLDTPHPYDLHGYQPADRWGTRQQIMPQRFADPAMQLDEGRQPTSASVITSSGRSRLPRQPSGRSTKAPTRAAAPSTSTPRSAGSTSKRPASKPVSRAKSIGSGLKAVSRLGVGPLSDKAKGRLMRARATMAAAELGMDTEDVAAVVRCDLNAESIARNLGIGSNDVKAIRRAYSEACAKVAKIEPTAVSENAPNRPTRTKVSQPKRSTFPSPFTGRPNPKLRSNPPVRTVVRRPLVVPAIGVCPSGEGPIGANDRCQCS